MQMDAARGNDSEKSDRRSSLNNTKSTSSTATRLDGADREAKTGSVDRTVQVRRSFSVRCCGSPAHRVPDRFRHRVEGPCELGIWSWLDQRPTLGSSPAMSASTFRFHARASLSPSNSRRNASRSARGCRCEEGPSHELRRRVAIPVTRPHRAPIWLRRPPIARQYKPLVGDRFQRGSRCHLRQEVDP